MKYLRIYILILFFAANLQQVAAQEKWSLNACIRYAMDNNLTAKRYSLQQEAAREDLNQSKRDMLPSLSASSSAGMSFGRSIDPNTNMYVSTEFFNNSYSLGSSVSLFRGWSQQNLIKYYKIMISRRELEVRANFDDLAFGIMKDFYDIVYYQRMLEVADEQVALSQMNQTRIEKMIDAGIKAKTDLLEVSANLESEKLTQLQIENYLSASMLSLKQKMNLSPDAPLEIEYNTQSLIKTDAPVIEAGSLFNHFATISPSLLMAQANFDMGQRNLARARSNLWPSLSMSGSLSTGYSDTYRDDAGATIPFWDQVKNRRSEYVGISLSIPIFYQYGYRSNIKKNKINLEDLRLNLEQTKQSLYYEIQNNQNELAALTREAEQLKQQLAADEMAFLAAEKKYEQGLISIIDYFSVKNRLANTKSRDIRTRLQWEIRKKNSDFYEGRRFWSDEL